MAEPFIKLYRKLLKWEWYDDANTKILFIHCLLKANWESGSWHGISYAPGQFITSLETLSKETHLTIKQVRVALNHLVRTGEVASKGMNKCRIITVLNWDEYQGKGNQKGKETADKGQSKGNQRATDKEYKEIKEIKNKKIHNFPEREYDFQELESLVKERRES